MISHKKTQFPAGYSEPSNGEGISRRVFIAGAGATAFVAGLKYQAFAQTSDDRHPGPTPTTGGGPPCDGPCQLYPFILIQRDQNDAGSRSTDIHDASLGPETSNIWIEDAQSGQKLTTLTPGQDYVIGVNVTNLGSLPSYTICIEFLVWTSTHTERGRTIHDYTIVSSVQGTALMQDETKEFKSKPWTPAYGMGLKPGDIIIRAYDPAADHYTETGVDLYVNRDRHLGHKGYS